MKIDEVLSEFWKIVEEAETLCFITRARELQEASVDQLNTFLVALEAEKQQRIEGTHDDEANLILGLEFACRGLVEELSMYLDLKDDDPDNAWNRLINAQTNYDAAARSHSRLSTAHNALRKLSAIERVMFPPQAFTSMGAVVKAEECSICSQDYATCDHIVGRPYLGQLCSIIIRDVELREVSLVAEPADKRSRITHFSDQGKRRNKMTWRLE